MELLGNPQIHANQMSSEQSTQLRAAWGQRAAEGVCFVDRCGGRVTVISRIHFIDRIGDGIYWIVSTDKSAGEDLRLQLGI